MIYTPTSNRRRKDPVISEYNKDWYKAAFELFKRGGIQYDISGVYLWCAFDAALHV